MAKFYQPFSESFFLFSRDLVDDDLDECFLLVSTFVQVLCDVFFGDSFPSSPSINVIFKRSLKEVKRLLQEHELLEGQARPDESHLSD